MVNFEKIKYALSIYSHFIPMKLDNLKYGFVSHPLTESVVFQRDNKMCVIDKNNKDEFIDWKIDLIFKNAKELDDVLVYVSKAYRVDFLEFISGLLSDEELTEALIWTWVATEFPCQNGTQKLSRLFKRFNSFQVMSKEDKIIYNKLPEKLKIYRGLQDKRALIKGLSWTLDLKKAKWFANRWEKQGEVYEAEIKKSDIYHFTNSRGEMEIIVNPFKLKNIIKKNI